MRHSFAYVLVTLLLFSSTAPAAPLLAPLSGGEFYYQEEVKKFRREHRLHDILDQIEKGDELRARKLLDLFLMKQPGHSVALELYATVEIKDKNYSNAEKMIRGALAGGPDNPSALAKLGVVMLFQGKREEGRAQLEKSLKGNSEELLSLLYLGWLDYDRGDTRQAIAHYERLIRSHSGIHLFGFRVRSLLGLMFNMLGEHHKTISLLQPLLDTSKKSEISTKILFPLFTAYIRSKNTKQAQNILARLNTRLPATDPELQFAQVDLAVANGDTMKARRILEDLLKVAPRSGARIHRKLATISMHENDTLRAISELEQSLAVAPPRVLPSLLKDITSALISSGKPAKAISTLKENIDKHPAVPTIRYLLAETQSLTGDSRGALATLKSLISDHPEFSSAHYLMGLILWHQNKRVAAREAMRAAVKTEPFNVTAWRTLAGAAHAITGVSGMESVLREGLAANSGHPELLFELGVLKYSDGRVEESIGLYRRALGRDPNHVPSLNNLAVALADFGNDPEEFEKLIERARSLAPNEPTIEESYGWVLLRMGKVKKALAILKTASMTLRNDGGAQYHLGVALIAAGKLKEGHAALKTAASLGVPEHYKLKIAKILGNSN
jgi:cellulose synthase operon protein C